MKHQQGEENKLRRQPNLLNVLEFPIEGGKQFIQNQHRPQLKMKTQVKLAKVVVIKN